MPLSVRASKARREVQHLRLGQLRLGPLRREDLRSGAHRRLPCRCGPEGGVPTARERLHSPGSCPGPLVFKSGLSGPGGQRQQMGPAELLRQGDAARGRRGARVGGLRRRAASRDEARLCHEGGGRARRGGRLPQLRAAGGLPGRPGPLPHGGAAGHERRVGRRGHARPGPSAGLGAAWPLPWRVRLRLGTPVLGCRIRRHAVVVLPGGLTL
mmetsp:Transcript_57938/g.172334  ORF Transcript_57938/g.172334 Transcript_57938/m.172334 type:complete len:212 (+) Transcript_57938:1222-1857(+)